MVAAYHLIWTAYGHWLPNDPRGSTSQEVHCANIAPLGELHYGRKRIQPAGQIIREFYEAARGVLKYELRTFIPAEVSMIACGLQVHSAAPNSMHLFRRVYHLKIG